MCETASQPQNFLMLNLVFCIKKISGIIFLIYDIYIPEKQNRFFFSKNENMFDLKIKTIHFILKWTKFDSSWCVRDHGCPQRALKM
jgi:hypothetical protein